jgi:hypothetical protein
MDPEAATQLSRREAAGKGRELNSAILISA